MKDFIIALIFVIIAIALLIFLIKGVELYVKHYSCDGIYPNPEIGGCGVHSKSQLNKKWCEENGGRFFGGGIGGDDCIFPPSN